MLYFFADGFGRAHVSPEVAANVAKVSPAPVYSPVSTYLGRGIVGGYMGSFEQDGITAADVALEILSGKPHDAIARHNTPLHSYQVDERQLQRWGISNSRLPSDAEIRFRQFSLWEAYRWQILGILAVLLLQAGIIAGLIIERRLRRKAELELRQRLLEVLHLNRAATAGILSSSVAHELAQPLAAIQSYADAAILYLKQSPPSLAKVEKILTSIQQDDQRAANIIAHLRGLLRKKDELETQEFDFNDVIADTIEIVGPEAQRNGVELAAYKPNGALPVRADRIQLQQMIVNLAMNGIDAMRDCDTRKMSISTALVDTSSVEVSISDTGTGIPPDKLNKVFEAFYTTKGHGTELGLSILRTIIQTFGGNIWAVNYPGGGALFRFKLPLAKAAQAH